MRGTGPEGASVYVRLTWHGIIGPWAGHRSGGRERVREAHMAPDNRAGCMSWENSWQKINGS